MQKSHNQGVKQTGSTRRPPAKSAGAGRSKSRPPRIPVVGQRTHSRYAQRYNRLHGRSGHLWQNRFFSCALGRDHLVTALAYVDLNPVRAGLVGCAEQYPWSTAGAHVSRRDEAGLVDFASWRQVRGHGQWGDVLRGPAPKNESLRLRQATLSGRPLGDEEFVQDLEKEAGRCLTSRRVGRPPRKRAAGA